MPLVRTDYPLTDAVEAVAKILPGEDPKSALLDAFRTDDAKGYVASRIDGRHWPIEPHAWGSEDLKCDWDTGQASYRVRGLIEPVKITGPVFVKRDSLDSLLKNLDGSASPSVEQPTDPPPRPRTGGKTRGPYFKHLEKRLNFLKESETFGEEYLENAGLKDLREDFNKYANQQDTNGRWNVPGRTTLEDAIKEALENLGITRR